MLSEFAAAAKLYHVEAALDVVNVECGELRGNYFSSTGIYGELRRSTLILMHWEELTHSITDWEKINP